MWRCLSAFRRRRSRRPRSPQIPPLPEIKGTAETSIGSGIITNTPESGGAMAVTRAPRNDHASNIILNHDFSDDLSHWHSNCCRAYVVSKEFGSLEGVRRHYAVVTERTETWQGLEQDITERVVTGRKYTASAFVGVRGHLHEPVGVQATVKLENWDSSVSYVFIARIQLSNERWEKLEGSFTLTSLPRRVVFYIEGPPRDIDLLIDNVVISFEQAEIMHNSDSIETIIFNPYFDDGLKDWSGRGCKIIHNSGNGDIRPLNGSSFASVTERGHAWCGIQQEITDRVQRKLAYETTAIVRILGNSNSADVCATLWVLAPNGREQYIGIAKTIASDRDWVQLKGKFLLNGMASKVVLYLEGPPPGIDILVNSIIVKRATKASSSVPPNIKDLQHNVLASRGVLNNNIITNHDFSEGLHSWSLNCCDGYVMTGDACVLKGISASTGSSYAVITNRTDVWQGLEQDITNKVSAGLTYNVSAIVRVLGGHQESTEVIATLKLEFPDSSPSYISIGRALVSKERWEKLEGIFSLTTIPERAIFYLEGPPPGIDLLIDSVTISCLNQKQSENMLPGGKIIRNSSFSEGLNGWSALGSCKMSLCNDPDEQFPLSAKAPPNFHSPLGTHFLLTTDRTETWMGPSQIITDKIKLHITYLITAWVRVGRQASEPQNVNVALAVDNQWINGGQVEAGADRWYEVKGSFRIEKQQSKIMVYVQGPSPGVDLMLRGLQIFAVDRSARYEYLKEKTDKVRKNDVILKFPEYTNGKLVGATLKIQQIENAFPFGSCINRSNIDNEEFVDFFLKNFNWAVFGNELKWYHTESQQGHFNYVDADEMLDFCCKHGIQTRGHCIFWEVDDAVQPWVRSLNNDDLFVAVQNRLKDLLDRYRGKFRHHDVNNEMLHGSFYQDRLGKDIRAYMFRIANQLDPSALLFVNDYNVEDGCDPKSAPDRYVQQILDLQERGAPVGGIGVQGHISHPVGEIICDALDKLAILGLPIWFTELDVSAENEYVRADDLEVVLREAFAHPAVDGVMLWGFWELFMSRDSSHLVDAEGNINEAGRRFLALKQEWLTHVAGQIDAQGEFKFRGYSGKYNVEITTPGGKILRQFVVDKGYSPLSLSIR